MLKRTLSRREPFATISPPAPSTIASRNGRSVGKIACNFFSHLSSLYITPPFAPNFTALSIFSWFPLVTYTLHPCATPYSNTISATPPPIPVTKIFRPGNAFPLFVKKALQAVNPVSGRLAASASLKCSGQSSRSSSSTVTTSANVPAGFAVVPPMMAYPLGASGPSGLSFQPVPGLRMTRLLRHEEDEGAVTMPTPSASSGRPKVVPG